MLKNCNKVNHTIGETGQSSGAGTAYIYGAMQQPWSYLMAVMGGSGLSWMENLPPCIQVVVLKVDQIVQVIILFLLNCFTCFCSSGNLFFSPIIASIVIEIAHL